MLLKAKPGTEPIKNQSATAAERHMESTPGLRPPNHALAATAGKKKMNGSDVGPTACVSASLAIQPRRTAAIATPYRCQVGRATNDVFENNVSADRMLIALVWKAILFQTILVEVFRSAFTSRRKKPTLILLVSPSRPRMRRNSTARRSEFG